jgi:ABC-type multidrug transport system ATPase subunit
LSTALPYQRLPQPQRVVGAVLEASSAHPGRRARDHLRVLAGVAGVGPGRVDEVLDLVGLRQAAGRRVGGFSLGMRQRLGLAGAILGNPRVLVLDEPANGLDPEGVAWLRGLLRDLAAEGRTVLVSSHVLSEVAQIADHVVIIAAGRLRYAGPLDGLAPSPTPTSPRPDEAVWSGRSWSRTPCGFGRRGGERGRRHGGHRRVPGRRRVVPGPFRRDGVADRRRDRGVQRRVRGGGG